MPKQKKVFTDFSGGEWSSKLEGRIDAPGYYKSCRILENFIIAGQGGAERRPGTVFVANGKTDADTVRLIPFELASGNYVLELGDEYMRFYKDHAQLEDAGNPVEIVTPWAKEDLFAIKYVQTIDAMYFVHIGYQAQKLTWTSDTVWNIANVAWAGAGCPEFTTADNRPGAIGFFQQKMYLAGTNNKPQYVWTSIAGSFEDFNSTDGLTLMMAYNKRIKIHWLASKQQVVFGATKGEGVLDGGGAPISKDNMPDLAVFPIGNANIQGIVVGDVFVSFHKGLKKVLAFQYSNDVQSWKPIDLTFMSSHILGDGVVEADLQTDPDTILWCVTSDGQLVGFTYESGSTMSWHSHPIGQTLDGNDKVESVAVITGDTEDEIWVSVKRTINSVTKRFVEYFKPRSFGSDQTDCYFADCGFSVDGGAAKSITGYTQADPVEITAAAAHGFGGGEHVRFTDIEDVDDGYVDYTTFIEIDEEGDIAIVADTITVTGLPRNKKGLVYKNVGLEYLDGTFEYKFHFKATGTWTAGGSLICIWGAATEAKHLSEVLADNEYEIGVIFRRRAPEDGGLYKFQLWELYNGEYQQPNSTQDYALNTDYYLKVTRDETVDGEHNCGVLSLSIYSDAGYTTLLETFEIDLHDKIDYSYLFAVQNWYDDWVDEATFTHTLLEGPLGRQSLNNQVYVVANPAGATFDLHDEDGNTINGFLVNQYVSGGFYQEVYITLGLGGELAYAKGETFQILADGAAHPDKTVDATGVVKLDRFANKIHGGLGYKSKLKPMRLTPAGVKKAAFKAIVRVYDSLGCKIGRSEDTLKVITFRSGDDPMDSAPPLFTGDKIKILTYSWDTDGDVLIVQDQPLPLNIAALIVDIEVNVIS